MFSKEFSVDIAAPIDEVFAYVSDLRRHPEWSNNKMTIEVEGTPVAVGTTFHTVVNAFGKESTTGKVIELEQPTRFAYECDTSASGYWRWTMTLAPIEGGTRLSHLSEGLRVPGWFKVVQPIMFPFVGKKMVVNGLHNIKTRVEAGAGKETSASS